MANTMSAYGRTWPLIETPVIQARIMVQRNLDPARNDEDQMFELDAEMRALLPPDIQIQVEQVHDHRLSPEYQAEHDRLQKAALAGYDFCPKCGSPTVEPDGKEHTQCDWVVGITTTEFEL